MAEVNSDSEEEEEEEEAPPISRSFIKHKQLVHMSSMKPINKTRLARGTNMKLKNCVVGHRIEP